MRHLRSNQHPFGDSPRTNFAALAQPLKLGSVDGGNAPVYRRRGGARARARARARDPGVGLGVRAGASARGAGVRAREVGVACG